MNNTKQTTEQTTAKTHTYDQLKKIAAYIAPSTPKDAEHQARDFARYRAEAERNASALTPTERRENRAEFADFLKDSELLAERARWLFLGSYGAGSYHEAREFILSRNGQNSPARVSQIVAAVEFHLTSAQAAAVFKTLTPEQQNAATNALQTAINDARDEILEEIADAE